MLKRGQTSTEYLVIIGLVLTIGLIVVAIAGKIPLISQGTVQTGTAATLQTGPLSISEIAFGTIGARIKITNNDIHTIQITGARLSQSGADFSKHLPQTLRTGESVVLESFSSNTFSQGNTITDYLSITYVDQTTGATYTTKPEDSKIIAQVSKSNVLVKNYSLVFISSQTYPSNLGGIPGADQKCKELAQAAGLTAYPNSKEWVAWLSNNTVFAATRLGNIQVPIQLINGTTIAHNFNDMATNKSGVFLRHPINLQETGATVAGGVWTATNHEGKFSTGHCSHWDGGAGGLATTVPGHSSSVQGAWTSAGQITSFCSSDLRIYCFEKY